MHPSAHSGAGAEVLLADRHRHDTAELEEEMVEACRRELDFLLWRAGPLYGGDSISHSIATRGMCCRWVCEEVSLCQTG